MIMEDNTYAYDHAFQRIHVSQAKSGRRGYYCMGCEKEMQAVKQSNEERRSYFRHDAKDVDPNNKCTYRDEDYRHKLAKEILERLKLIKVPSVYKYPPPNVEGGRNLLEKSKFIKAFRVEIEKSFYEDDSGQIQFGNNPGEDEMSLIIKPHVTFLDENNIPILIIEFVSTHKPDFTKQAKLRRLGINTIQVSIPKDSPEKIEAVFSETSHTKWIYNELEATTQYIPVPTAFGEGVLPFDVLERQLYEESFKCRAAQVGNLIRAIERCLESESLQSAESDFEREIERISDEIIRIDGEIEDVDRRLGERKDSIEDEVIREHEHGINELKAEGDRIRAEEEEFRDYFEELEKRYTLKTRTLEFSIVEFDFATSGKIKALGGERKSIEDRKRELREEEATEDREIENIEKVIRNQERIIDLERGDQSRIERPSSRPTVEGLGDDKERELNLSKELREQIEGLPEKFRIEEEQITLSFSNRIEEAASQIKRRFIDGDTNITREIKRTLHHWKLLGDIEPAQQSAIRAKHLYESFKRGTYKNW